MALVDHFVHVIRRCGEFYAFTQESSPFIGTLSVKQSFKQSIMRMIAPYRRRRAFIEDNIDLQDNVTQLRVRGNMPIDPLNEEEVTALRQLFFRRNKQEIDGFEADDLESLEAYMQQKQIQRSFSMIAKGNDELATLWRRESNLSIVENYLKVPRDQLNGIAYIDCLGYVEKETNLDNLSALSWHRDSDHKRFLKIFYLLTDCEEGLGHHEYITGSHRKMPIKLAPLKNYDESDIRESLPDSEKLIVTGKKGTGFAEDTFGFHRGTAFTKPGTRLLLQLIYYPNDISWGGEITANS